jgi:hypothetical protein
MRTTIRMNPALARRAKQCAAQVGQSFTQLVEAAVTEHLARQSTPVRRRRHKLPVSRVHGPALTHEQIKAAVERADVEYDLKKLGLPAN